MKVAIVHDWLAFIGGAEKVVLEMLACFPEADLFVIIDGLKPDERELFHKVSPNIKIRTSFIQKLPFAKKHFEYYLPLMPIAVEQWDLRKYDLVISSNHAFAKGIITSPDQLHISYVNSPIRYAWDMQSEYLSSSPNMSKGLRGIFARIGLHYLRIWDLRTVPAVDVWLANSNFIRRRIKKFYRVDAKVLYPAVETSNLPVIKKSLAEPKYYVTCSRLVEYKRIDLIVSAFVYMYKNNGASDNEPRQLRVIGEGPMETKLKAIAEGCHNIKFEGRLVDADMHKLVARSQAFIFAAKEDFGIAPLDAQALGIPVIAYGAGGALETVVDINHNHEAATGVFFQEQSIESLISAIAYFEQQQKHFQPDACRRQAKRFSKERFRQEFTDTVMAAWQKFRGDS